MIHPYQLALGRKAPTDPLGPVAWGLPSSNNGVKKELKGHCAPTSSPRIGQLRAEYLTAELLLLAINYLGKNGLIFM